MSNIPSPYGGPDCAAHRQLAQAVGVDADRCDLLLSSVLGSRIASWQSPTDRDHPLPEWPTFRLARGFVARIGSRAKSAPAPTVHGRRTYSGRPSSSMRLSEATAMATSVLCRPSVRERSASPITRL